MAGANLKRIRILSVRDEMESVLRELIGLGCVDVFDPVDLLDDPEMPSGATRETLSLEGLNANHECVAMIGTQYTLTLSGWIAARSAPVLLSKLPNYICAWEISDASPDESDSAPVHLCCPGFFGKLRAGGRRLFSPLTTGTQSEA